MSGGFFEYRQHGLEDIAEAIDKVIRENDNQDQNEYGQRIGHGYPWEVIEALATTAKTVRMASQLVHHADWLLRGDDGEETYLDKVHSYLNGILDESRRAT